MTFKNTKTILFAGLIAAMILPFSGMMMAEAVKDDKSKSDHDLFKEADKIEKKYNDHFKYDKDGKNKSGTSDEHKRHQEIVKELNSRGIFHKSQDQTNPMIGVPVNTLSSIQVNEHQSVDVFLMAPEVSTIETNDSACTSCGDTHDKKLSFKSGIEWNSPSFPWWEYRVESTWSAWTATTETKTSSVSGDEYEIRPYVMVKSDHAVTWADFQVLSEVKIMDQNGKLVSAQDIIYQYTDIYFPYTSTELPGYFPTMSYISAGSVHEVTLQLLNIE